MGVFFALSACLLTLAACARLRQEADRIRRNRRMAPDKALAEITLA